MSSEGKEAELKPEAFNSWLACCHFAPGTVLDHDLTASFSGRSFTLKSSCHVTSYLLASSHTGPSVILSRNFTTCHIRTRELFRCSKHSSLIPFSARSHCGNSVRSLFKCLLFLAGVGRQTVRPLTAAWRCSCTSSLGSGRNTAPAVAAARGLVNPAARKEAGPLLMAAPVGPIWGSCSRCFPPFFVFFLFFFFWGNASYVIAAGGGRLHLLYAVQQCSSVPSTPHKAAAVRTAGNTFIGFSQQKLLGG